MIYFQATLHAFGIICGVGRQEDQMKLDGQAEECLKRLVYTAAANTPKLRPSVSSNMFSSSVHLSYLLICDLAFAVVFLMNCSCLMAAQAFLLSVLQQDLDIRIAVRRLCLLKSLLYFQ
jgi:hypothetical protein